MLTHLGSGISVNFAMRMPLLFRAQESGALSSGVPAVEPICFPARFGRGFRAHRTSASRRRDDSKKYKQTFVFIVSELHSFVKRQLKIAFKITPMRKESTAPAAATPSLK